MALLAFAWGIRRLFLSIISFTQIEKLSSQNAHEGPSYADLQALRVDSLGMGGYATIS